VLKLKIRRNYKIREVDLEMRFKLLRKDQQKEVFNKRNSQMVENDALRRFRKVRGKY